MLLRSAEHMENWARVTSVALSTGVLPSLHHPLTKLFPAVAAQDVGAAAAALLLAGAPASASRVVNIEGPQRICALAQQPVGPRDRRARTAAQRMDAAATPRRPHR